MTILNENNNNNSHFEIEKYFEQIDFGVPAPAFENPIALNMKWK